MASLREGIALELVARLNAIDGWGAVLRGAEETTNVPVLAIVGILGETKRPRDTLFYACTLRLGVLIRCRREDATVEHDDNGLRLLDELVAQAEAAVHGAPWPNEEAPTIEGHEVEAPGDAGVFEALLTLTVDYRHNLDDPTTYDPSYTP